MYIVTWWIHITGRLLQLQNPLPYCILKNLSLTAVKGKVKAVPLHAKQAQWGDGGIPLPVCDPGIRTGWVVSATPSDLLAKKETWYPLYRRLFEP